MSSVFSYMIIIHCTVSSIRFNRNLEMSIICCGCLLLWCILSCTVFFVYTMYIVYLVGYDCWFPIGMSKLSISIADVLDMIVWYKLFLQWLYSCISFQGCVSLYGKFMKNIWPLGTYSHPFFCLCVITYTIEKHKKYTM